MRGNSGFQIGTGVTSIFMIFVVLCLTTFGILSYTSAQADMEISRKHADYISSYYEAYSLLNDDLARIDGLVCKMIEEGEGGSYGTAKLTMIFQMERTEGVTRTYEQSGDIILLKLVTDIDDKQQLIMEVSVNINDVNNRYKVNKCYVYSEAGDYSQGETLPDMWGG